MIDVQNLTKRYGSHLAVDDVSFRCEPGTITGFLGPNGAGKSTTLRMLMGLTPPSSGAATIAGVPFVDLPNPGRVVGVMLDASAQHVGRSGLEVLRLSAQVLDVPKARAQEVLHAVGLDGAETRLVGNYSLGMRQRLGIANALLGDPEILVLDEPANGMDPEGIRWMRDLLQDFAGRGGTVLLSSHLLGEVQATVDRLVVIGRGRILADATVKDLLQRSSPRVVTVRTHDVTDAMAVLANSGAGVTSTGGDEIEIDGLSPERVAGLLAGAGLEFHGLAGGRTSLESIYLDLTRSAPGPPPCAPSCARRPPPVAPGWPPALLVARTVGFSLFHRRRHDHRRHRVGPATTTSSPTRSPARRSA